MDTQVLAPNSPRTPARSLSRLRERVGVRATRALCLWHPHPQPLPRKRERGE